MNVTNVGCAGSLQNDKLATVAIKPGMLIERVGATGVRPHSTAGAADQVLFAENSIDLQTMRDGEYAIGDNVMFHQYKSGDIVNAVLKTGENVAASAKLASAGDGYLRAADVAVAATKLTGVVADNNALTFSATDAGILGNNIKVALLDPSAANQPLTVSVEGTEIHISLKTGSGSAIESTAAEVKAAVNADTAASILVTAADTGASTGAGVVAAVAAGYLTGGLDADNYIALADAAVNATSAAKDCVIRIK